MSVELTVTGFLLRVQHCLLALVEKSPEAMILRVHILWVRAPMVSRHWYW
jgi:hypothetical protein